MKKLFYVFTYLLISIQRPDFWRIKKLCENSKGTKKQCYIFAFERWLNKKGSWIGWNSQIAGAPCFPHGISGIFISGDARIGKNAVIFQQVTIGSNRILDSMNQGSPTIGDNCYIGAGAKVIGNVTIGNNCRIGAGTVITKNIPDNSLVVGGDIRIIHKDNMDNRYITKVGAEKTVYFDDGQWKPLD